MPKKIFICITKSNWGGAQRYVYDLSTSLPKTNYNVSVLFGENGLLEKKLKEKGIETIQLKNSQRNLNLFKDIKLLFELIKLFKKEKPDIIHLNSSKMGLIGSLAGKFAGIKKIVFTVHGWAFNEDRSWLQKFIFWKMQAWTVLLCDTTIAVSEDVKKQLKPKYLQKNIEVIHNGIDEFSLSSKEEAKNKIITFIKDTKLENTILNKTWIGTISELHKNKGLKYAVEAINKIDNSLKEDLLFVIIGEGEERKEIEKLLINLKLENKVFLTGRIENASSYLKAFDIFTLTSITESLGYVLLEAGKAEVPVIASKVGGIPEIINDSTGFLVERKNPEKITEAIEYILKNPEKSLLIANNLKNKVDNEFTLKEMMNKTIKIYLS